MICLKICFIANFFGFSYLNVACLSFQSPLSAIWSRVQDLPRVSLSKFRTSIHLLLKLIFFIFTGCLSNKWIWSILKGNWDGRHCLRHPVATVARRHTRIWRKKLLATNPTFFRVDFFLETFVTWNLWALVRLARLWGPPTDEVVRSLQLNAIKIRDRTGAEKLCRQANRLIDRAG